MRIRFSAVSASIVSGAIVTAAFAQSLSSNNAQTKPRYLPEYTASGDLVLPKNFHEWVYVGSPLTPTEPSGRGYFPGPFNGGDATVKDTKRYADTGGWGYYDFNHHEPKAPTAKVRAKEECAFCHMASAKKDQVWTQFYPLLDIGMPDIK